MPAPPTHSVLPVQALGSELIISKCISLKCMASVMKISHLGGGLGFFCCQLTRQGGFVSGVRVTAIPCLCHLLLPLSWTCEEAVGDL